MKIQLDINDLRFIFKSLEPVLKEGSKFDPKCGFVYLKCIDNSLTAFATDSHRIHFVIAPYSGDNGQLIIPVVKLPKAKDQSVEISEEEEEITFDFFTEKIIQRKPDVDFPNYEKVMPKEEPTFKIAFNPQYIRDAANMLLKSEYIVFNFYSKRDPCVIEADNSYALVCPYIVMKRANKGS